MAKYIAGPGSSLDSRSTIILIAFVLGLPLWWALGLDFMTPIVLASFLVMANFQPNRDVRPADILLFGLITLYTVSAGVNGFFLEWQPIRVLAALYNISILTAGLIVLQHTRAMLASPKEMGKLLKAAAIAFAFFAPLIWLVAFVAYASGQLDWSIPTLVGAFLGKGAIGTTAPLIERSLEMGLTRSDWGIPGIPFPRVYIYGPYPTATAVLASVLGAATLLFVRRSAARSLGGLVQILVLGTILITLTRSVAIGWLAGLAVANLVFGSAARKLAVIVAMCLGVTLFAQYNTDTVSEYRPPTGRFENYDRAISETLANSPIIGKGLKAREEGTHIALGSHSTVVSAFTKGGVLGLGLVAVYFFLVPMLRWIKVAVSRSVLVWPSNADLRILLTLQVTLWCWLCFEDVDAPAMAAMLVFISLALIEVATEPANRPADRPAAFALRRAV